MSLVRDLYYKTFDCTIFIQLGFSVSSVTDKKSSSILIYLRSFKVIYTDTKGLIKRLIKLSQLKMVGAF